MPSVTDATRPIPKTKPEEQNGTTNGNHVELSAIAEDRFYFSYCGKPTSNFPKTKTRGRNLMQITFREWLAQNDYASADEALADYSELDDNYSALCSEGCQVEPDGH